MTATSGAARFTRAVVAAACLAAAGCATTTEDTGVASTSAPAPDTSARTRARIHTDLAASYFELGNMGVALDEIKEALRADPGYGPANNVAGLVYSQLKEDRLAEESFQAALQINPSDSDAHNNYGRFLCDRKQEREAIKHFLAAVRNPLYATPERSWINAGVCARRAGDLPAAEGYFQQALKLRPGQPQALYQMADLAYARRNYAEAKGYLTRLTQVATATAEVLWLGVRVERRLGDRASEASYALQLRNRYPNSREAQALLAGKYE
jgi:type IV pilus assembly protein PilF